MEYVQSKNPREAPAGTNTRPKAKERTRMTIRLSIQNRAASYGVKIIEEGGDFHVVSLAGKKKWAAGPTALDALEHAISKHGLQLVSMKAGKARNPPGGNYPRCAFACVTS